MGRSYLFQKPYMAIGQGIIDFLGYSIFRKSGNAQAPSNIKKILVSRIDHFGDVFIASSILPHLKIAYPSAKIHFMAGEWAKSYLRSNPNIDRVLIYNSIRHNRAKGLLKNARTALSGFVGNVRKMRAEGYDLCIDLRAYPFNSIPLMYLGGGRCKVGFATGGWGFLLDKIVPYREGVHEISHVNDTLKALGIFVPDKDIKPEFTPSKTALKECSRILEGLGITEGEQFVLIHTGCGNPKKQWKKECWQELIDKLSGIYEIKVLVYDTEFGDLNGCIKLPSLISFELFAAAAKRATLFIGLDSLPAHLAASFSTPVVAVWCGINDSVQWRPVGRSVRVVKNEVDCSPCFRKNGCSSMECMEIRVDDCLKEASRYLDFHKNSKVVRLKSKA